MKKEPQVTIAEISGYGMNQNLTFTSVHGHEVNVSGELIDQTLPPTGELVEAHTEVDEDYNVIHVIYVRY